MRSQAFLAAALLLSILAASPGFAAGAIVRDGGTVEIAGVAYRLDGIDAPEVDQMCIDDHADAWACGVDAVQPVGHAGYLNGAAIADDGAGG